MSSVHGTLSCYSNHKCRCDLCSEAARIYFSTCRVRKRQERIAYAKQYYVDHKQELKPKDALRYAEKPEYKESRKR